MATSYGFLRTHPPTHRGIASFNASPAARYDVRATSPIHARTTAA